MKHKIRWTLLAYDALLYFLSSYFILVIYPSSIDHLTPPLVAGHMIAGFLCIFVFRVFFKVYEQIWRYAGPTEYIRLLLADFLGGCAFLVARYFFDPHITFVRTF